ncbi:MAG: class I SAM-dependent methyltransferase [Geobacter sp.]|nr:class I SAM-dependent methyltransferase [Geobacter sp.]
MLKKLKWKIKISVYNQNIANLIDLMKSKVNCGAGSRLVDIGCNDGVYTRIYCNNLKIPFENAHGLDYNSDNIKLLPLERFFTHDIDVLAKMPFDDCMFDVLIMNQVLEHTKNISQILAELNRITKTNGKLFISVPNIAALHNRSILLFGGIPLCIQDHDVHIRGFTKESLTKYVGKYGFEVVGVTGSGLYPFWGPVNKLLGRIFPQFSVFFTLMLSKVSDCDTAMVKDKHFHETKIS